MHKPAFHGIQLWNKTKDTAGYPSKSECQILGEIYPELSALFSNLSGNLP